MLLKDVKITLRYRMLCIQVWPSVPLMSCNVPKVFEGKKNCERLADACVCRPTECFAQREF